MSYANSRIPHSAQQAAHEKLPALLDKHLRLPFRKPFAACNVQAFEQAFEGWVPGQPLILDAGCGVGHSTIALARAYPDHWVIGVDQSADRLARRKPYPLALMPRNLVFVRADLVDFWRLLARHDRWLDRHYVLYPNPWPKVGHLSRRWQAHPVFPWLVMAGGWLECRTNWSVYAEEFSCALQRVTGSDVVPTLFDCEQPLTPFERKYRDSGQPLYRIGPHHHDVGSLRARFSAHLPPELSK